MEAIFEDAKKQSVVLACFINKSFHIQEAIHKICPLNRNVVDIIVSYALFDLEEWLKTSFQQIKFSVSQTKNITLKLVIYVNGYFFFDIINKLVWMFRVSDMELTKEKLMMKLCGKSCICGHEDVIELLVDAMLQKIEQHLLTN